MLTVQIREMYRCDLPVVMAIEHACFAHAWTEADFLDLPPCKNYLKKVADLKGIVVGFIVYTFDNRSLKIQNLAVDPVYHRLGIGTQLVGKLIHSLREQQRNSIEVCVRETNLAAQLFFKSMNFAACDIDNDHYENGEAAYVFDYLLPIEVDAWESDILEQPE